MVNNSTPDRTLAVASSPLLPANTPSVPETYGAAVVVPLHAHDATDYLRSTTAVMSTSPPRTDIDGGGPVLMLLNGETSLGSSREPSTDIDVDIVQVEGAGEGDGAAADRAAVSAAEAQLPVMRSAIFTMLPIFMGYASLVTLQGVVKEEIGIKDGSSALSYEFSFATSFLYLGNLIFRLMHNVVFFFLTPRHRVALAYASMSLAIGILGVSYFLLHAKCLWPVFVAYLLGGVAIGTFESNLISCLTPLGHRTKAWAQYGITFGFNGISIGAFLLFTAFPLQERLKAAVYLCVAVANIAGLFFYLFRVPNVRFEASRQGIRTFLGDAAAFRSWVPTIWTNCFALMIDMFAVGCFSALQIYIYDVNHIPLFFNGGHGKAAPTIPQNAFRAIYNLCSMLGDGTGRKFAYTYRRTLHPCLYLGLTVVGGACILSKQAIIAPLGQFFVMFGNGAIYATTTRVIDDRVDRRFNLIALSFWLFLGDVGSFSGANVVNVLRVAVGSVG